MRIFRTGKSTKIEVARWEEGKVTANKFVFLYGMIKMFWN